MKNIEMATLAIVSLLALAYTVRGAITHWKRTRNVRLMANTANSPTVGETATGYKTFLAADVTSWSSFITAYPATTNPTIPPGRFAIVKLGATAGQVTISAGATDNPIGIAQDAPDALTQPSGATFDPAFNPINVRLLNSAGTARMIAAAAITNGDLVQSNGDGAVKTAVSTGYVIGRAIQAAGAAGDVIEVMLMTPDRAL